MEKINISSCLFSGAFSYRQVSKYQSSACSNFLCTFATRPCENFSIHNSNTLEPPHRSLRYHRVLTNPLYTCPESIFLSRTWVSSFWKSDDPLHRVQTKTLRLIFEGRRSLAMPFWSFTIREIQGMLFPCFSGGFVHWRQQSGGLSCAIGPLILLIFGIYWSWAVWLIIAWLDLP